MATAQIVNFPPRPAAPIPALTEGEQIPLWLALRMCQRHGVYFDAFYRAQPGAVMLGDASVDRDAFAAWLGIGRAA